ncbi:tetratricopeptide repeat protein [Symmachiella dynata]|uniref:tetratricopeptide repeat protein n=1 Tax=Symmachiella dynata TaxID=2527995 RepID=UPI0030EF8F25
MSRREKLEELLAADPTDTFLQYSIAMEYRTEGDLPAAEARFQTLLKASPDYVPTYFRLGEVYAELDRIADAREILTTGIETATRIGDQHAAGEMTEFRASLDDAG